MSINLKDAVSFLLSEGYIYSAITKLHFSKKAYDELGPVKKIQQTDAFRQSWEQKYTRFIMDAGVPARAEDSRGDVYSLNKYSDKGMKAFRIAIGNGVDYGRLVLSTQLYYKSSVKLKVAIGRYMEEGLWRTDYDAFTQSAENNSIAEHVKQQTSNGTHSSWELG